MSAYIGKNGVVFVCIAIGVLCVSSLWAEEKNPPPPDPYANVGILVEAFVVEVPTAELQDVGVNPIGQGPDGISIFKLAACLHKETAAVISGAKVSVKQNREGKSREDRHYYLKQVTKNVTGPQQGAQSGKGAGTWNITFRDYNFGKTMEVSAKLVCDTAISTDYKYSEGGLLTDPKNYDPNDLAPPDTYNYSWEGILSLYPGKPVIAGAMQNKDNVVFLILTATIQNMPEAKQEQTASSSSPN